MRSAESAQRHPKFMEWVNLGTPFFKGLKKLLAAHESCAPSSMR